MEVKNELRNERINFKDKMSEIKAAFSDELANNAKKIGNRDYKSLLGYSFVGMSSENTVGNTASFLCTAKKTTKYYYAYRADGPQYWTRIRRD